MYINHIFLQSHIFRSDERLQVVNVDIDAQVSEKAGRRSGEATKLGNSSIFPWENDGKCAMNMDDL